MYRKLEVVMSTEEGSCVDIYGKFEFVTSTEGGSWVDIYRKSNGSENTLGDILKFREN